jgi:hypothetical protein
LADPSAPQPDEVLLTAQAGTVAVMNAHLWHGGTANRSDKARLALHSFYCRRDLPQQQYQKRLLRPQVQQQLDSQLRWLLALDDPLNDEAERAGQRAQRFFAIVQTMTSTDTAPIRQGEQLDWQGLESLLAHAFAREA